MRQFGLLLSRYHSRINLPAIIGGEEFALLIRTTSISQVEIIVHQVMQVTCNM
ncbi:hypothetical protein DN603_09525 [Raoultella planticola]|uniref:GGDEF domain-containing protein n=1 Tax=Raoultella planticola TaxID=575 RepID=A0A443VP82_RAOPL|nr:hypothetical protein DN603_09525 [Raoultella planticola]